MARDEKGRFLKGNKSWQKGNRKHIPNCLFCEKIIDTSDKRRKFCNHSCSMKHQYNNGRIVSKEFRNSIKGLKKGQTNSGSFKEGDIRITKENNPNWNGGITPLNILLRKKSMWKIWREAVFLRDNFTCQNKNCKLCNNKIGIMLHPHHIKPLSQFPELVFEIDNGITYCAEFHLKSGLHVGIKNMQRKC